MFVLAVTFFVGALAGGVALGVLASRQADEQRLLRQQGVDTHGLVTRLWRNDENDQPHWAAYRFTVHRQTYQGRTELPHSVWKNLQVGSDLTVHYLPSDPGLSHPLGRAPKPVPLWVPWLVAGTLAAIGGLFTLPLRRQRWLLAEGRPALAVATRHVRTDKGTVTHYEFVALSGSVAKGRRGPSRRPPLIGATFCVIYDPDHPRRNAPYPLPLVEPVYLRRPRARP